MLGHILYMKNDTPAHKAMQFSFEKRSTRNFGGRKRAAIHTTINCDMAKNRQI